MIQKRASNWLLYLVYGGLISAGISAVHAAGALAVGKCGAFGSSWNYKSQVLAQGAALTRCPDTSCQVYLTVVTSCVALAYDTNNCAWGANTGLTLQQAVAAAIAACQQHGGTNCVIRTSFCDTSGE
ncbi:MAG: DUF4189 domain-containing protein [Candidatus Micrarchaeaceae archaeon]